MPAFAAMTCLGVWRLKRRAAFGAMVASARRSRSFLLLFFKKEALAFLKDFGVAHAVPEFRPFARAFGLFAFGRRDQG
jgi:hypothetical protein